MSNKQNNGVKKRHPKVVPSQFNIKNFSVPRLIEEKTNFKNQ